MEFHGTRHGLKVVDGRESDILISVKFMSNDNQDKFGDYMAELAAQLRQMEPFSDEMTALLQDAEEKVQYAATAEKFLEEVTFK